MRIEKISLRGKARKHDSYILNITKDETHKEDERFTFNTVEDLERFIDSYPKTLVTSVEYGYEVREQFDGTTQLDITACTRLLKGIYELDEPMPKFKGYRDLLNYGNNTNPYFSDPYFELDEALRIAKVMREENDDDMYYDEKTDAFILVDEYSHIHIYEGVVIDNIHFYPIGIDGWIWSMCND